MKVSVVIPWRPHPSRIRAFEILIDFYKNNFKDFDLIISDSTQSKFNLSQARNLGASQAIKNNSDVIIFNDADLFATPAGIKFATETAFKKQEIVAAYDEYYQHESILETNRFFKTLNYNLRMSKKYTPPPGMSKIDNLPIRLWPCSGCIVVPKQVFIELGGFEEKISGWGPEDTMFHRAYFEKYKKLFTYAAGQAHSTFNDPHARGDRPENQHYKDLVQFKDKRK
jgi:predicted glycosyltransferase involved in capsule biosynthesis